MAGKPTSPASAGGASLESFRRKLSESGLLDDAGLNTVLDTMDDTARPRDAEELAAELVRRRKLTPYQCDQLKKGEIDGLVIDQYTVVDRIGQGGMGQVLKAYHNRMQRYVALKIIAAKLLESPQALERFEQEARAAAQLSHPNIVAAYDAGEKDGMHYLVLEYVDGQDLATIVARKGPLRVALAIDYIIQAAEGLSYAHSKGIIHRDVKPANLLVDSSGVVKILDMGLALMSQAAEATDETTDVRLTQHGQVMGTTAYMAPEQAVDTRNADARSDIYALGCTLHELLVGRPPYHAETMMGVIVAHREEPIPSLPAQRVEVPASLQQVFEKMMAKKPEHRYASMSEVLVALRSCTPDGGSQTAAPPPARPVKELEPTIAHGTEPAFAPTIDTVNVTAATEDTAIGRRLASKRRKTSPLVWIAMAAVVGVGLLGALGAGAAAVVLSLRTPHGTLVVESDDPDVQVAVKQSGKVVEILDADDDWQITLAEGKYQLDVTGGDDQFQLDQQEIVVTDGEVERLRVTMKPVEVAALPADRGPKIDNPKFPKPGDGGDDDPTGKPAVADKPAEGGAPVVKPPGRPAIEIPRSGVAEAKAKLKELHVLTPSSNSIRDLEFSADGKSLVVCDLAGTVSLWDVATGESKSRILPGFRAGEVAFAPDGKTLAIGGDRKKLVIYDAVSGDATLKLSEVAEKDAKVGERARSIFASAYSPDGTLLVSGSNDRQLQFWNTATGEEQASIEAHDHDIMKIAFSPNGTKVATASWDGTAKIWNPATQELLHTLKARSSVMYSCVFSHDSSKLYTVGNGTDLVEWDVATGDKLRVMRGHGGIIPWLALSADGKMIVTSSSTDESTRFWDVETGNTLSVVRNDRSQPYNVAFSPVDATLLAATTRDGKVRLLKYEGGIEDESPNLAIADDGTIVIKQEVGDDHVLIPPWQTFTAPVDGKIALIELMPNAYLGIKGKLSVYEGAGLSGKVLHSQDYAIDDGRGGMKFRPFILTTPVDVDEGKVYTWELTGAKGLKHANTDRYPHGGAAGGTIDHCFRIHFVPLPMPR